MLIRTKTNSSIYIACVNPNNKYWNNQALYSIINKRKMLTKINLQIKKLKLELNLKY